MSDRKKIALTDEQKAVVECPEKRFLVKAAAGAGKTSVLVELFLRRVLMDGCRADEILTITFTRKAAAEMKRRIVARLIEAGLVDQAQVAETGPIQTIHGFCERMLRENALAAGLDPDFEVLEGSKKDALFDDCLRRTLADASELGPEAAQLTNRLIGKFGRYDRQPQDKLSKAIRETVEQFRGCGESLKEIRQLHCSADAVAENWRAHFMFCFSERVRQALEDHHEYEWPKILNELNIKPPKVLLGGAKGIDKIPEAAADTCGLVLLACSAWELFESGMAEMRALDFTKLEACAVQLLENNPDVWRRLQGQYKLVLIDEAQDLNPMQYRLLTALDLERSMMVGDAQQSIYGFRQADVRLFKEAAETMHCLQLSKNFRSEPGILSFVDAFFMRQWPDEYTPMGERPDASDFDADDNLNWSGVEFWVQRDKDTRQIVRWIKQLHDEGVSYSDITVLTRKNAFAVEIHTAMEAMGVPSRVFGGSERFYTRLVVRDIANVLRALTDPYEDFALLTVLRSPFVGVSFDAIALLATKMPVVEALETSELPNPEDNRKIGEFLGWFKSLSPYADRLPAWEAIGEVFAASRYLESLARKPGCHQLIANARKVLALAVKEPDLGPSEFAERIREIQEMGHREGDAPAVDESVEAVTLMTIHKAKGLEFPVVVVPEVHWKPRKTRGEVIVDPWLGLAATRFNSTHNLYFSWLAEFKLTRELQEEDRLLYVALTRAQKRLCVVASNKESGGPTLGQRIYRDCRLSNGAPHGSIIRSEDHVDNHELEPNNE